MYLNGTKCAFLALSCFLSASVMAKNIVPTTGQGVPKPLCFIENKGQMESKDVQFTLSSSGVNLYIGKGQLHYQFRKMEGEVAGAPRMRTYRMDVTLLGANPNATVETTGPQAYFENFYNGSSANGITAHSYSRITYKEVYPGIDWVLYLNGDKVEYDFVVHPGADAGRIQLQYGGASKLGVSADGGICATTPLGTISEKKPYAYEAATGKEVAANFRVKGDVVSFETGKCNGTLTIDPFILWSSYFGGTNEDVATAVRVSPAGNIYIGGYSSSTTLGFTGTGTPYDITQNGGFDAFITKYDAAGVRQFTTYFGGAGNDRGTCLAINSSGGTISLGGVTQGSTGLASGGAYRGGNSGLIDGFIFTINNNGTRQWSTYYGGPGNDYINGITNDGAANNVYVTGRTESATLIASAGVFQTALSGSADAFIARFNGGSGANSFSTYYGGTGVDEGQGISADASGGNVVITGQTNSIINIATAGAYQATLGGSNDAFVAKINNNGTTRLWGTYFGGSGSEQGSDVVCNTGSGLISVIGYTTSTSGIASANAHQATYGGGSQDAFVASFSGAGAMAWSTYYGGNDIDLGESIALDPNGNIIVAGATFSNTGISTPGSLQPALGGNYDAFVGKLTRFGQRMWGTYFGNTLYDYGFGVACDGGGQILLAGHTTSTAGIATAGSSQTAYGGGTYDAFITKFRPDTFAFINQPFTDTLVCAGGPLTVSYTANFAHQPGNTFTAQLSNAAGSFATPINIGSATAVASGTINCTIPGGTPVGSGYRIRIVSSNPAYTSPDQVVNIQVVSALPAPTVTSNTPVCVGGTINVAATAPWTVNSYSWSGPAGFTGAAATGSVASVTTANGGVYSVTLTHNGCPPVIGTTSVFVNTVIPTAPVAIASTLNCNGGTIYLGADTAAGSVTGSYFWSGPGGFTDNTQFPTITPATAANAGVYSVVDTINGCPSPAATVTVTVTPNSIVSVSISVSPNDTVCGGTSVSFNALPINGGVSPAFQWMNGATPVVGAITGSWSSSTLTDGAMISCVLTSNAVCPFPAAANSNVIKMNVITNEPSAYIFANPGISVNPGDSIVFSSAVYNVGVGATYQWRANSTDIPGATNATYTRLNVTTFDTISLVVTSTMACATSNFAISNKLVAHPNTAVNNVLAVLENVELFPNPNNGTFHVTGDLSGFGLNEVSLTVLNPLGQVVYNSNAPLRNGKLDTSVQTSALAAGIYMLNVTADGVSKAIRFTVQH
ncbi:MAG: SBBP repeat-containing protein [Chitinophagaceae bacterium]|nr:SBBP repeat-containing protein [Chitinophagaceae bacterium]